VSSEGDERDPIDVDHVKGLDFQADTFTTTGPTVVVLESGVCRPEMIPAVNDQHAVVSLNSQTHAERLTNPLTAIVAPADITQINSN